MARATPRDVRPQTQSTERTNGRDVRSIPNSSPKLSWRWGAHCCPTSHPIAARSASARCRARGVDPAPCTGKVVNCRDRSALGGRGAGDGWRLRNMLANPGVALTWWDEAAWAERLGYAQQDASLSAGVFRALRESNLRLLESVPRARWVECYGIH